MKRISFLMLLVGFCLILSPGKAYAARCFLHMDGIPGESTFSGYEDWIEIENWTWQVSNAHASAGSLAESLVVRPLIVQKNIDSASPLFTLHALTGANIANAELVMTTESGYIVEFLKLTMTQVKVANVSPAGSIADDHESVALVFDTICYAYTPQSPTGAALATIERCFDFVRNTTF